MASIFNRRKSTLELSPALNFRNADRVCAAYSSSRAATHTGDFFPLGVSLISSMANSSQLEKNSGSSGLTVPKRFGLGVSLYGFLCLASVIAIFQYISGQ